MNIITGHVVTAVSERRGCRGHEDGGGWLYEHPSIHTSHGFFLYVLACIYLSAGVYVSMQEQQR